MSRKRGHGGLLQAGEIPLMKTLAKKFAPPTRAHLELLEVAAQIREQPDAAERVFMARQLILCTLPHSDPGDVLQWTRRTGSATLGITPGRDYEKNQSIGYPFGIIPRLLLFWITTEVQHTKNRADLTILEKRTLHLGRSLAEFMREVGLNPARGGKRGDGRRLHNQMDRLFNSHISFQHTTHVTDDVNRQNRLNMDVAPETELWWDVKRPEQGALWQSWIRLGEQFYNALVELPVPVDTRALKALKRSPLALDLYALICLRAFLIVQKNQPPQFISWEALRRQLGTDYSTAKNFKPKAQAALRKIVALYPGLNIGKAKGGFTIHATRLAVPTKAGAKLRSYPR
jgi:Plasmid encoded RepA protein